jgi:hypothetical protein
MLLLLQYATPICVPSYPFFLVCNNRNAHSNEFGAIIQRPNTLVYSVQCSNIEYVGSQCWKDATATNMGGPFFLVCNNRKYQILLSSLLDRPIKIPIHVNRPIKLRHVFTTCQLLKILKNHRLISGWHGETMCATWTNTMWLRVSMKPYQWNHVHNIIL